MTVYNYCYDWCCGFNDLFFKIWTFVPCYILLDRNDIVKVSNNIVLLKNFVKIQELLFLIKFILHL